MDHHNKVRKQDKNRLPALANVLYYVQILRHVNFADITNLALYFGTLLAQQNFCGFMSIFTTCSCTPRDMAKRYNPSL